MVFCGKKLHWEKDKRYSCSYKQIKINNSKELEVIKNSYGEDYFKVYSTSLTLKESSLQLADSTHSWFYYPVRYKGESFDDYKIKNLFDKSLDLIAHYILYLEILIALFSIVVSGFKKKIQESNLLCHRQLYLPSFLEKISRQKTVSDFGKKISEIDG